MKKIKKIKCFIKNTPKANKIANQLLTLLEDNQFEISDKKYDLGIAIGGDGTFLHMVKDASFNSNILYVGMNAGTLGFAQEFSIDEIASFIECLKKGFYSSEKIGIGEVEIVTKNEVKKLYCLNEVAIRDRELNAIGLDVLIEEQLLENYKGDGLIITTSFGSTAYNLSFGGSIVYNDLHTLQITPIAPIHNEKYHTLKNSIIVPSKKMISLLPSCKDNDLVITIDGDNYYYQDIVSVNIVVLDKTIKVIRKKDYSFIKKVNEKFL